MDIFSQPPSRSGRAPMVQNHRYKLLNPETGKRETWSRVTTFAKTLSDTAALEAWGLRMTVKGLAMRPDLLAGASQWDVSEHKTAFAQVAKQAKDLAGGSEGADRGTRIHDLTELHDRGMEPPANVDPGELADVQAYASAINGAGLVVRPEFIERYVAIPHLQLCGKLDRIYGTDANPHLPNTLMIGDVKTAKNIQLGWLEIAIQLVLYATATHYWDEEADDWVEMPGNLSQTTALVTHVRYGSAACDLYAVDLTVGQEAVDLCQRVRAIRGFKGIATPLWQGADNDSPHARIAQSIQRAANRQDLSQIWQDASAAGEWTADLQELGMARMRELAIPA